MSDSKPKVPPVADRLIYYVKDAEWPLFVDQHGEAHTFVGKQAVPISRANRALTKLMYKHEAKAPSNDGLIGARRVLDMLAHDSGDVRELHTRSAFQGGAVYYELAPGRVVRIDEAGWEPDPNPPVSFRAIKNLKPLPNPVRGGKLEDVTDLVNLKTARDKRLFMTYVTLVSLAHVQRYILQTTGVMGSGKSTASRVVKRLMDPTGNETVTVDRRDFLQKAAHCYILMLDNQNTLPDWFQDTLCRLVTGESDSKRVLYSDDEDLVWSMMRAVLLNGINPPGENGDLQDRVLPIELERLKASKRLADDDFWMQFNLKHPELLGAVFDALSGALKARHTVNLDERPRLADWGLYAAALYESQGWGVDTFKKDWRTVEETQQQGTLDGSIVAQAVIAYMKDRDRVEKSASKLHAAIKDDVGDDLDLDSDKTWPKTGRTLWRRIRVATPLLEVHGIRAYRKNDNSLGRPIILDSNFEDDEPEPDNPDSANYAKHADDTDNTTDDIFGGSSASSTDTYAEPDDNAATDDKPGLLSGSHTLSKKKEISIQGVETTQPESSTKLSSAAPLSSVDQKSSGGEGGDGQAEYSEGDGNDPAQFERLSVDEKCTLADWISSNLQKGGKLRYGRRGLSSYFLKHRFGHAPRGFYIYNGAFKGAMAELGYEGRDYSDDPNRYYDVRLRPDYPTLQQEARAR
jgi:hypothetical protein